MSLDVLKRDLSMVTTVFFDLYDQHEADHEEALRRLARIHDNRQTRENPVKLDYLLHFPKAYSWLDEVEFKYTLDQLKWTIPLEGHQVVAPFNRVDVGRPNTVAQVEAIVAAQPKALMRREIELISTVFHENPISITGRPFFSTDHSRGPNLGTFSNIVVPVFGPDLTNPPLQVLSELVNEVITRFASIGAVQSVYIDDAKIRSNLLVIVHNERHQTLFRELQTATVLPGVTLPDGTVIGERQNPVSNTFQLWRDPHAPQGQQNYIEFVMLTEDDGAKPAVYVVDTDPEPIVLDENRVSNGFYGIGFQKIFAVKPFVPNTSIQVQPVQTVTAAPGDGDPPVELTRRLKQTAMSWSFPDRVVQDQQVANLILQIDRRLARLEQSDPAGDDPEPAIDPAELLEQLPDMPREAMEDLHEQLSGRRPHGNAKDESVRDTLRSALEERITEEHGEGV